MPDRLKSAAIDVACACDDKFVQHAAVVVASALATTRRPADFRFWILTAGLNDANRRALEDTARARGAQLQVVTVDIRRLHGAPVSGHITLASYFRIFLPELLPADVTKLVYLDADVVVRRDLAGLMDVPLDRHPLGAVINPRFARWDSLGIPPASGYFNAGVLLINLAVWREERLQEKLCELIATRAHLLELHDQDALNMTVAGRWLRLDPRWNQQYSFYLLGGRRLGLGRWEYLRLLWAPHIVHFSGSSKPWLFADDHPFRHLYYRHLAATHRAGWKPRPLEAKDWVRKLVRFFVPHRARGALFGW